VRDIGAPAHASDCKRAKTKDPVALIKGGCLGVKTKNPTLLRGFVKRCLRGEEGGRGKGGRTTCSSQRVNQAVEYGAQTRKFARRERGLYKHGAPRKRVKSPAKGFAYQEHLAGPETSKRRHRFGIIGGWATGHKKRKPLHVAIAHLHH